MLHREAQCLVTPRDAKKFDEFWGRSHRSTSIATTVASLLLNLEATWSLRNGLTQQTPPSPVEFMCRLQTSSNSVLVCLREQSVRLYYNSKHTSLGVVQCLKASCSAGKLDSCSEPNQFKYFTWRVDVNLFTPKLKKYILSTFQRENNVYVMYWEFVV